MFRLTVISIKMYNDVEVNLFSLNDFAKFVIENGEGRIKDVQIHILQRTERRRGERPNTVIGLGRMY